MNFQITNIINQTLYSWIESFLRKSAFSDKADEVESANSKRPLANSSVLLRMALDQGNLLIFYTPYNKTIFTSV